MPTVYIDGKAYNVGEGKNMLEVCLDLKLNLPYFCWHPAMHSVGACRQCAVRAFRDESDTKGKIVMACMTPAAEGTRISINDPEAVEFRRYVIEWLMTNHPHDCPVCDEGGECHLQDMTTMSGHVYRRFRGRKRTYYNQYLGPFVNCEMNRCIQCYRCVRFYRDFAGGKDFNVFGSKNRVYFGREMDGVLESEFSGNLVEVCPTGVFTDKTLKKHYTRKWDLETAPSVCIHCGLGCNTMPGARYKELRRIRARYNREVNGYFICNRGRYGYEFVNDERRIRRCCVRDEDGRDARAVSWEEALTKAKDMISKAGGLAGIGSPRASLEANYALRKLVGENSFSSGLSTCDQQSIDLAVEILRNGPARTPSLREIEGADVVLIVGADPTNEAPMLDFSIRQAMNKACLEISRGLKIPDWDAHAVQNALQGRKGKLYAVAPWRIKLEEIAVETDVLSYPDIAQFASDAAESIRSRGSGDGTAAHVAQDLLNADQPLIVSSISAGPEVLKAAGDLARALSDAGKAPWLSITVPEANSMGVSLLGGAGLEDVLKRVDSGEVDTLIVMENDLSRRIGSSMFEALATRFKNLIVLDCIETPVTRAAAVVLPVQAYIESDGTFINNEGRAQRFYQAFVPTGDLRQSWRVLQQLGPDAGWLNQEDLLREMVGEIPELSPVLDTAPPATWRSNAAQKVARMPHRYSGRTAMDADRTIHEPRPPDDPDTPLAFTMEGDQNPVPGPLTPRFWWPGWNSMNSITKFQMEVNGPLFEGNPGKRLIEPGTRSAAPFEPQAEPLRDGEIWIVPRPRIFGSEELSSLSQGIAELAGDTRLSVNPETARKLSLKDGDRVTFYAGGGDRQMVLRIDESVARDVAAFPAGFEETLGIVSPVRAKIARTE